MKHRPPADNPTCNCGTPTQPGRTLCNPCVNQLAVTISQIPFILATLDDVIANRINQTKTHTRRGNTYPLPINLEGMEVAWIVQQTVYAWADQIAAATHRPIPQTHAGITKEWINQLAFIATWHQAGQFLDEISHATTIGLRIIDRPKDTHYIGQCSTPDCEAPLFATIGAHTVICPRCGSTWETQELRHQLSARVRTKQLPAPQAEQILKLIGVKLPAATIRSWRRRGKLHPILINHAGQPVYQVGDILDILDQDTPQTVLDNTQLQQPT